MMRLLAAALLAIPLLAAVSPAAAQSLPPGTVLAVFKTTGEMRAAVNRLSMPDGDPFSARTLKWRANYLYFEESPRSPLISTTSTDCRLYTKLEERCFGYEPQDAYARLLAVRRPYEVMPIDRVPLLDRWHGPLGHTPTSINTDHPSRSGVLNDPDLRSAFARLNPEIKAGPGNNYSMEFGLALVPLTEVRDGAAAWARAAARAKKGAAFACRRDDGLCHVVVRLGAADSNAAPLIAVCRTFRFTNAAGKAWLATPGDCRAVASELDGRRRLLAITDIQPFWEGGDSYPAVVEVRGLPGEQALKQALRDALNGMDLSPSAARGSRVIGDVPNPKFSREQNSYLRRFVATDYEYWEGKPPHSWIPIDIEVWVHEYVQNRADRPVVRGDLEQGQIALFRSSLLRRLTQVCGKVVRSTGLESGYGLDCVGYRGAR
jgi:hypothetical protein